MKSSKVNVIECAAAAIFLIPTFLTPKHTAAQEPPWFLISYYDVATSRSPSASGYGGNGASGGIGDGLLRIVNGGQVAPEQRGTLCALIYVFDDIEEMQACCGCPVTPDGLRTMSVINNVTKNFGVNRGNLNAGVVDIVSAEPNLFLPSPVPLPPQIGSIGSSGWACDPSGQFGPTIGVTSPPELPTFVDDGLRAWMDHNEANASVPAAGGSVKGLSVSELQGSPFLTLDPTHGFALIDFCLFLITNGSGTGACSCGAGDNFSNAPVPQPPVAHGEGTVANLTVSGPFVPRKR